MALRQWQFEVIGIEDLNTGHFTAIHDAGASPVTQWSGPTSSDSQRRFQTRPFELWARVCLAPRWNRNVVMADAFGNRICVAQDINELSERAVLHLFEGNVVAAFELDTDGEVIAPLTAAPLRYTGMPGALLTRHELHEFTIASDQKMGRYGHCRDLPEIRIGLRIKAICEQLGDGISAETAWRQADAVDDNEFDPATFGARIAIWRWHLASRVEHTGSVQLPLPATASICVRSQRRALS